MIFSSNIFKLWEEKKYPSSRITGTEKDTAATVFYYNSTEELKLGLYFLIPTTRIFNKFRKTFLVVTIEEKRCVCRGQV